jgi:hypothetical protein
LKDFRSAMFVSPPPPWGSTLLYGTEAAIHESLDSMRVTRTRESRGACCRKHGVCRVTHSCWISCDWKISFMTFHSRPGRTLHAKTA